MKRMHRILSFILVMSLLLTAFVIPTAANDVHIDEDMAIFTPTADFHQVVGSSQDGEMRTEMQKDTSSADILYFGFTRCDGQAGQWTRYLVNTPERSYAMFTPDHASVSSGTQGSQSYFDVVSNKYTTYGGSSDDYRYYIFEMDVATEGDPIRINPQVITRKGTTSDGLWGSSWNTSVNNFSTLYCDMTAGVFHHMTFVADIHENKLHVYIDNEYISSIDQGLMSTAGHELYKNGTQVRIEGMRIQASTKNIVTDNMSLWIDNIDVTFIKAADIGNLPSLVSSKGSINDWTANGYHVGDDLGVIPDLVEINGVRYNNIDDANKQLDNTAASNSVSALRSLMTGHITVNCNAEIHTHSTHFPLIAGPNASIARTDAGVYVSSLDTYHHSLSMKADSATNLLNYVSSDAAGNRITSLGYSYQSGATNSIVYEQSDRNMIWSISGAFDGIYPKDKHTQLNAYIGNTHENHAKLSAYKQIVYDMDVYTDSEFMNFYSAFNIRVPVIQKPTQDNPNPSSEPIDTSIGNNPIFFDDVVSGAEAVGINMTAGEWYHVTFVGDVATGNAYVYVNGTLVYTREGGLIAKSTIDSVNAALGRTDLTHETVIDYLWLSSFRTLQMHDSYDKGAMQPHMSVVTDNHYMNVFTADGLYTPAEESIIGKSWAQYSSDYSFPALSAIAVVDGVEYYTTASLNEALASDYQDSSSSPYNRNVTLLRDIYADITIDSRATIDTNNVTFFNSQIGYAEGTTTATVNGKTSVYKTDSTLLAAVDLKYFSIGEEDALEAELASYSDSPRGVIFLSAPSRAITVSGNALIDINGFDIASLINADGAKGYSKSTTGEMITVDGPQPANMSSAVINSSNSSSVYNEVKYVTKDGETENTFAPSYYHNMFADGVRTEYLITNTEDRMTYAYSAPSLNGVFPAMDNYFELKNSNTNVFSGNEYVIIDIDLAFDTYNDSAVFELNARKFTDTGTTYLSRGGHIYMDTVFNNAGIPLGEFAHATIVASVADGDAHVYVNGVYAKTYTDALYKGDLAANSFFDSVRCCQRSDAKFAYDNVYIRITTNESINDESFTGSAEDIYTGKDYQLPVHPMLATVNGEKVYSASRLQDMMYGDSRVEVEFLHLPSFPIEINTLANIETNGYAEDSRLFVLGEGFKKNETKSHGTFSVIDREERYGTLSITLNMDGKENKIVDSVSLVYGTDIKQYLEHSGILYKALIIEGKVWSGITWDGGNAPEGKISSPSVSFSGSPSEVIDDDYIFIDSDGTLHTLNQSDAGYNEALIGYLTKSGDSTLIFNRDWVISRSSDNPILLAGSGSKNVYLNGNTISSEISANSTKHAFLISGADYTFYGDGTMDFRASTSTQALFFGNYDAKGTIRLNNISILLSYSLAQLRSGNITVDGCKIETTMATNWNPFINIGEDYNGSYSTTPVHVSIINSDINVKQYVDTTGTRYSSYSNENPLIKQTIATTNNATDPNHRVYIEDSRIVTSGTLLQASLTANSTPAHLKSNLRVFISNSEILASDWAKDNIKSTVIVLIENVKTNIDNDSEVSVKDNVIRARISDSLYKFYYTSEGYASVTWSDGTEEFWAEGSLPYNLTAKFDDISSVVNGGVVAGASYSFTSTAAAAPFKFYASLTLSDTIGFNLLVPSQYDVKSVTIAGKYFDGSEGKSSVSATIGGECMYYTVEFAPHEAAKSFHVTIVLTDGTVMSREASVGKYAQSLWEAIKKTPSSAAYTRNKNLLSVALAYIEMATVYAGNNADMTSISSVLSSVGVINNAPSGTDYAALNSNLTQYIKSAQVNLKSTCAIRFNAKDGFDLSTLTYIVDGKERAVKAGDGWVEISLRAFEMGKDITIKLGDTELGGYNLYSYYVAISSVSGSTYGINRENSIALRLIRVLWNYANTADQYLDAEEYR